MALYHRMGTHRRMAPRAQPLVRRPRKGNLPGQDLSLVLGAGVRIRGEGRGIEEVRIMRLGLLGRKRIEGDIFSIMDGRGKQINGFGAGD